MFVPEGVAKNEQGDRPLAALEEMLQTVRHDKIGHPAAFIVLEMGRMDEKFITRFFALSAKDDL
jgi:hypothetical protein